MDIEKLRKQMEEYADSQDLRLNPNKKMQDIVLQGLLQNKKKYKKLFCPCRVITKDQKENQKIICPCYYHKEEIEERGHCLCNLFVKK